jgi:hypothetical protein
MPSRLAAIGLSLGVAVAHLTAQSTIPAGGVIRGVVRDTLGSPIPGAVVQLVADAATRDRPRSQRLVAIDTADGAGRFEFSALAPQRYVLTTHVPRLAAAAEAQTTSANDSVSVVLTVRDGRSDDTSVDWRADYLASLSAARARWASRGPSRYRLTATMDCYCRAARDGARALEFVGDSLASTIQQGGRPSTGTESWTARFSVTRLFAHADAEIRNLERTIEKIEYDPDYGYPTVIATNTAYFITDAWLRLHVADFRPVP